MRKSHILSIAAVAVLVIVYIIVKGNKNGDSSSIITAVKHGKFTVEIETTGELDAKNSVKIIGPLQLRDFRIWNVNIQSIVEEGTIVKKGDWVATLDRSEFQNRLNEKQIELEKANSQFAQTQLDTTLQLRQSRDELINLKYGVDENVIVLEQSKFEPPATIKQAEINMEKARRAYEQALENYKIKKRQNIEKMRVVSVELRKVQNESQSMSKIMASFAVLAPEDGMVIYEKGWDGKPLKSGSQVNMWEGIVATLPDLTKMKSKTYVNEVDVRKVKVGQKVQVGLDAYPDKKLFGVVIHVANVGEQRPNSDGKVFAVDIEISGTDPTLRPSMTTSNNIIIAVVENALYIPLECLHSQHDSITYVYKKDGLNTVKQEVIVGETNANDAVILGGLLADEKIYLSVPVDKESSEINLLKEMNGKRRKPDDVGNEVADVKASL